MKVNSHTRTNVDSLSNEEVKAIIARMDLEQYVYLYRGLTWKQCKPWNWEKRVMWVAANASDLFAAG